MKNDINRHENDNISKLYEKSIKLDSNLKLLFIITSNFKLNLPDHLLSKEYRG